MANDDKSFKVTEMKGVGTHDGRMSLSVTPVERGRTPAIITPIPGDVNSGRIPTQITPIAPEKPSPTTTGSSMPTAPSTDGSDK